MSTIEERKKSLLLADFAYLDLNKNSNDVVILKDIIDLEEPKWYEIKSDGTMKTDKNGNKIVKKEMEHDYKIAQQLNENAGDSLDGINIIDSIDLDNGLQGVAVEKDGEITIAYRGTEEKEDAKTDVINIPLEKYDGQFSSAAEFFEKIASENPNSNINLTGHSLGGALAQYVTLSTNNLERINKTTTYSSPGIFIFGEGFDILKNYLSNYSTYDGIIENYRRSSDMVSDLGINVGTNYVYKDKFPISNPIMGHFIGGFFNVIESQTPTSAHEHYLGQLVNPRTISWSMLTNSDDLLLELFKLNQEFDFSLVISGFSEKIHERHDEISSIIGNIKDNVQSKKVYNKKRQGVNPCLLPYKF